MIDDCPKLIVRLKKFSVTRGQVLDAAFAPYFSFFVSGTKLDDESTICGECISGFSHR